LPSAISALACFGGEPILFGKRSHQVGSRIASGQRAALFDRVAGEAETYSDLLARRAAGLGAVAEGAVQVATERSFLVPYPLREHLFAVAATIATFGQSTCEAIGRSTAVSDADTADLFTEISRGVDHQLCLVESHAAPI
jgi:starvation-inducible DNA-binding protein